MVDAREAVDVAVGDGEATGAGVGGNMGTVDERDDDEEATSDVETVVEEL